MFYALCHVLPYFFLFLFYVDARVTCSRACMMLLAMPCLDLFVYSYVHMTIWLDPCLHMLICLDLCSSMPLCLHPHA